MDPATKHFLKSHHCKLLSYCAYCAFKHTLNYLTGFLPLKAAGGFQKCKDTLTKRKKRLKNACIMLRADKRTFSESSHNQGRNEKLWRTKKNILHKSVHCIKNVVVKLLVWCGSVLEATYSLVPITFLSQGHFGGVVSCADKFWDLGHSLPLWLRKKKKKNHVL